MRQEKFLKKCREMIEFEEFVKTRAAAYYGKKDIVKRLEEKGLKFDICFLYGYFGQKEDYGFVRPEMKFGYNCELLIQIRKVTDQFADWDIMTVYNLISLTGIMRRDILGLFSCPWFRRASIRTVDKLLDFMNETAKKVLREGYDKVLADIVNSGKGK